MARVDVARTAGKSTLYRTYEVERLKSFKSGANEFFELACDIFLSSKAHVQKYAGQATGQTPAGCSYRASDLLPNVRPRVY